jgi:hypothetical protein
VVKRKRMRLDSIRRVRLALEMGDSSVIHDALPAAPDAPKLDRNIEKKRGRDTVPPKKLPDSNRAITMFLRKDDESIFNDID